MADLKPISQFNAASAVDANTLFLVSTPNGANYDSENASAALVADAVVSDFEYTQDLQTADKTIVGAINENKSVIGYSYDEYDPTTAYSKDDLCIYNNTLYKALQATTGNLPTNTTYWEQTSIADEIGRIDTELSGKTDNTISSLTIESNTKISQQGIHFLLFGKIITLSGVFRAQNTQIMAQETIWTIKNHNLAGQSTDQYYIPVIVDGEQGYFYLVVQNDGNDIKIFSNINVQMPKLMFFNGVLPIV